MAKGPGARYCEMLRGANQKVEGEKLKYNRKYETSVSIAWWLSLTPSYDKAVIPKTGAVQLGAGSCAWQILHSACVRDDATDRGSN